MAFAI